MDPQRPIWLLDVDGVLNAFDESGPVIGDWGDWAGFTTRGFPIRYSPAMTARIRALHDAGRVEVRWLTTWGRYANTDLQPLGLPQFEVAAEQPFRERGDWWKLAVARDLFNQGHAVIWTDDDITFDPDTMKWLDEIANSARAGDLYAVAPRGAISQKELDELEKWLSTRAESDE